MSCGRGIIQITVLSFSLMGKKGGSSSWLTAVKRAFWSPNKDSQKKTSRRKVELDLIHHPDQEAKKTERRRWLFRKNSHLMNQPKVVKNCTAPPVLPADQRHAIAVAAATAKTAEAAVATAKAAVEIIRLTQPTCGGASDKQQLAARMIQTAFRGYLARRALIALKGIVKLQALVRGQNVRKQASLTLKCMQALLRVQARVRDQRTRLSFDLGRRSMFSETGNLWEYTHLRNRKSRSRDGSCVTDATLEELEAILKARNESERENLPNWPDYRKREYSIKTVEIDSLIRTPLSYAGRKSPVRRPKSPQVRRASHSTANTPSLRSGQRSNGGVWCYGAEVAASVPNYMAATESAKARVRSQSAPRQRPPPPTPERDRVGSAKKRLSYPVPDPSGFGIGYGGGSLKSPSFKGGRAAAAEERSLCYTESVAGEISPCSTTDLRRWLR